MENINGYTSTKSMWGAVIVSRSIGQFVLCSDAARMSCAGESNFVVYYYTIIVEIYSRVYYRIKY